MGLYAAALIGFSAQLVLDRLHVLPAVAYSLRLLSNAYHGKCINVRRSSDNTVIDIGFVNGKLDTVSLLNFVGTGNGFVTAWYNQGSLGSSGNATQSTFANQPQIVASGVVETQNGLPTVYFGGSQYLQASNGGITGNATGILSALFSWSSLSGVQFCISTGTTATGGAVRVLGLESGDNVADIINIAKAQGSAPTLNVLEIMSGLFTSTNIQIFSNGNSQANTLTTRVNTSGNIVVLGAYVPITPAYYAKGNGSEFVQLNNLTDKTTYDLNAAAFYGISGVTQ